MTFLRPEFLWLLATLPLVVLLHFLRNRRRHQLVSALFLWQQASNQASARRRFALWWLLLLQLLAVALLAAALAGPVLVGRGVPDRVLVIDGSASMAARDPDGVRLVKALRIAGELAGDGGRVALVRAGSTATVVTPISAGAQELSVGLAGLVAADASSDLAGAIELAAALAPDAELHLFTDQQYSGRADVTVHAVAGGGHNLGISTFDLGPRQAFVAVTSTWPRPQTVTVELQRDGQPAGSAELLVPAAGQGNVSFPIEAQGGLYGVTIRPPEGDALQLDDVAWAGSRQLSYYMLDESAPLQRALAALPGLVPAASASAADLIVTSNAARADALPRAGGVLLFAARSADPHYVEIRDWDQSDPLLRFVDLMGAQVGLDSSWSADSASGLVLARGGDLRPVIAVDRHNGRKVVQLGFNPSQSDIIYRPAFPTLVANIVQYFRGEDGLRLGDSLPEGTTFGAEPVSFAWQPGIYEAPGSQLTASLLSAAESRLPGPAAAETTGRPPAESTVPAGDSDLVIWLLVAVPLLLLAEWLLWSRRSSAGTRRLIKSEQ